MANAFTLAGVTLDIAARRLVLGERWLAVTQGELEELLPLLENAGGVVPHALLSTSRTAHIASLRRKLDALGAAGEELLVSIDGVGYHVPGTVDDAQRARLLHMSWLTYDPETRRVSWFNREVQLTKACGKLFAVLLAGAGRTVPYEALAGLTCAAVVSRLRSDLARLIKGSRHSNSRRRAGVGLPSGASPRCSACALLGPLGRSRCQRSASRRSAVRALVGRRARPRAQDAAGRGP